MSLFDAFYRDQTASTNPQVAASATRDEFDSMGSRISAWALVEHNEDGTHNLTPSGFDFVPIGAMMDWPVATPPPRWVICDGSQVSRTTYVALFNVIGTFHGAGDGSTTFNLPDFRGRSPLGKAAAGTGSTLGQAVGALDHTHTVPALTVPALSVPGLSIPGLSIPALSVSINTDSQGTHNHGGATGGPSNTSVQFNDAAGGGNNFKYAFLTATGTHGFDDHTHSISSDGAHTHLVSGNTGTGTSGTGTTGTGSTGTGSTGTGTSGTSNHACLVINRIMLAGV